MNLMQQRCYLLLLLKTSRHRLQASYLVDVRSLVCTPDASFLSGSLCSSWHACLIARTLRSLQRNTMCHWHDLGQTCSSEWSLVRLQSALLMLRGGFAAQWAAIMAELMKKGQVQGFTNSPGILPYSKILGKYRVQCLCVHFWAIHRFCHWDCRKRPGGKKMFVIPQRPPGNLKRT